MSQFSDDGLFMRAGYGPRLRCANGSNQDFKQSDSIYMSTNNGLDQFSYIEQLLSKEPSSRRGIITMNNPYKDCFERENLLKITKDFPCTCSLHFMLNSSTGALDLITHMRSNDLIWGASAVNIFNFTFMQEYFSAILNVPIGAYYHIVNNLHYYEDKKEMIVLLSKLEEEEIINPSFEYSKTFSTLSAFDERLNQLTLWEGQLRTRKTIELIPFNDPFFDDWAKVLYYFTTKKKLSFTNPILNQIFAVDEK